MKANTKLYDIAQGEPLEVQNIDGHQIEIYKLNDYTAELENYTSKGRFSVWSSKDGQNYRLFVEEGYLDAVPEMYTEAVNKEWLSYWDACEKIGFAFHWKFLYPVTFVIVAAVIVLFILGSVAKVGIDPNVTTFISLGLLILLIVALRVSKNVLTKKIGVANDTSVANIENTLTKEVFEDTIAKQKKYIDEYFAAHYNYEPEEDEAEETEEQFNSETPSVEAIEVAEEETKNLENEEEKEDKKEE